MTSNQPLLQAGRSKKERRTMLDTETGARPSREVLTGELTDAALEVFSRHGVQGPSVAQELELWKALAGAAEGPREEVVARAADATYRVALSHGFRGPFVDVETDLWKSLCHAARTYLAQFSPRPRTVALPR
jgi:hypothetical protein